MNVTAASSADEANAEREIAREHYFVVLVGLSRRGKGSIADDVSFVVMCKG